MAFYLRLEGDPCLRERTDLVTQETFPTEHLDSVVENMSRIMVDSRGVGLAANQVGIRRKFFIYDKGNHNIDVVINPEIVARSQNTVDRWEGCLSIPGKDFFIPRYDWVIVHAENFWGQEVEIRTQGYMAQVFQHEIDHLEGVLLYDYATPEVD